MINDLRRKRLKQRETLVMKQKTARAKFLLGFEEPKRGYVSLTFDDGPNKRYTPKILDILNEFEAKATFFLIGKKAKKNPNLVRRIFQEGHEIGNHTYNHSLNPIYKFRIVKREITLTEDIIKKITGEKPYLFRPPGIFHNKNCKKILNMAKSLGYLPVMWSVSTVDWLGIKKIIMHKFSNGNINHGDILLLHDGIEKCPIPRREATVDVLPEILHSLKNRGLFPLKVSELLQIQNRPLFSF